MDWNLGYTKILKNKNKKPPPASRFFAFSDYKLMFFFHGSNSHQRVRLSNEKRKNYQVYENVKTNGRSIARISDSFKGIHEDIMTEMFNKVAAV